MFSFVCGVLEEIQVRRYLSEGEKAKNPLSVGVADGTVHVGGVCSQPASVAEGVTVIPAVSCLAATLSPQFCSVPDFCSYCGTRALPIAEILN